MFREFKIVYQKHLDHAKGEVKETHHEQAPREMKEKHRDNAQGIVKEKNTQIPTGQMMEALLGIQYNKADLDKNGFINIDEFMAIHQSTGMAQQPDSSFSEKAFKAIDLNRDEQLDFKEFFSVIQQSFNDVSKALNEIKEPDGNSVK